MDNDVRAQQFWNAYATAAQVNGIEFTICGFGDSAELADALVALVIAGTKRATASLARDYTGPGQPLPKSGDCSVVIDGHRRPRCIIRTVNVDIKAMRDVDERFAWDEGEGDRSLGWWMSAHTRYFARQGVREGFVVDGDTRVVLQRFEVVWPLELADRTSKRPDEELIHPSQPNVFP